MNGSFFNLIMTMLIPLIMVVCGWLFMHGIPKDRNSLFGYRTAMSVKNDDTWRFAHEYCGRSCLRLHFLFHFCFPPICRG